MKVYVTKYALTQGIFAAEGQESDTPGRMFIRPGGIFQSLSKNEWASDRTTALKQAEKMRRKKIESLRKQGERLENLEIEVHE